MSLPHLPELRMVVLPRRDARVLLHELLVAAGLEPAQAPLVRRTLAIAFGARVVERAGRRWVLGVSWLRR